MFNDIVKTRQK